MDWVLHEIESVPEFLMLARLLGIKMSQHLQRLLGCSGAMLCAGHHWQVLKYPSSPYSTVAYLAC